MTKWYTYRRWIYLALLAVLLLDALVYFGWVTNAAVVAEADPAQVRQLAQEVDFLRTEVERLERARVQVPKLGTKHEEFFEREVFPPRERLF